MSVAKVMEITSQSPEGFDHAIKLGIERANKTVDGIRGAWIKEQKIVVEGGKIQMYRVDMKLTFELRE